MSKKIIIKEASFKRLMVEEYVHKSDILSIIKNSSEMKKLMQDISKETLKNDKDLEKKVKDIVAKCVNVFFKTLWQRSNFYEDEIRK